MDGTAFGSHFGAVGPFANAAALLAARAARAPDAVALRARTLGGWRPVTWAAWEQGAREIAAGLATLGVGQGDRVALLGSSSLPWATAEQGILRLGAVAVPLPPTCPPGELVAIARDADVSALFVEPGLVARTSALPPLRARIALGPQGRADGLHDWEALCHSGRVRLAQDATIAGEIDGAPGGIPGDAAATILYTAGTTAAPKGVVLSHRAAVFQACALAQAAGLGPADEQLLTLPAWSVFGRNLLWTAIAAGATTAIADGGELDRDLAEVAPTYFAIHPARVERLAEAMRERLERSLWPKSFVANAIAVARRVSALRQRGQSIPLALAAQFRFVDARMLAGLRRSLGGRVRFVVCGGASVRRERVEFLHALGILVLEGYGMAETGGAVTWNRPDRFRFGSVGCPLPGCSVAIAADGEIRVRTPAAMTGYHGANGARVTTDEDGWLRTGDVGELRDGFLQLVDRRSDLIGSRKPVAPQMIEAELRATEPIGQVVVLEGGRDGLVALVDLDEAAAMGLSAREQLGCRTRTDLVWHPRVLQWVSEAIAATNAGLRRHERVASFVLLPEPLRAHEGELSTAGQPRRDVIARRHADLLRRARAIT